MAGRAWPGWVVLAVAGGVFATLWRPVAARRTHDRHAAAVTRELPWIERAVAAAAIAQSAQPGEPIPPATWCRFLDPQAPDRLRNQGIDSFGHLYGAQEADRDIVPARETLPRLRSAPR